MAKRIRGTIPASGPITIEYLGASTVVQVTRQANGSYDAALPSSLDTAMEPGGAATIRYLTTALNIAVPVDPGYVDPGSTGGGIGVVGQAPPTYSGTATLSAIPSGDPGTDGLRHAHYGNGLIELLWRAPANFNVANGDKYEITMDGIIVFRDNSGNSMTIEGVDLGTSHTVTARMVRDDGTFGPSLVRQFSI